MCSVVHAPVLAQLDLVASSPLERQWQVRKSMARIKLVLREREIAEQQRAAATMVEAGEGEGQQQTQA